MRHCGCVARSSTHSATSCRRRWISRSWRAERATACSSAGRFPGVRLPFLADDEACAAAERPVRPRPLNQHRQAIAKAAEAIDMYDQPEPPREVAAEAQPSELGDRAAAADGRHLPEVVIAKWCALGDSAALHFLPDDVSCIDPFLHRYE